MSIASSRLRCVATRIGNGIVATGIEHKPQSWPKLGSVRSPGELVSHHIQNVTGLVRSIDWWACVAAVVRYFLAITQLGEF